MGKEFGFFAEAPCFFGKAFSEVGCLFESAAFCHGTHSRGSPE
jgi:hypothetical protein